MTKSKLMYGTTNLTLKVNKNIETNRIRNVQYRKAWESHSLHVLEASPLHLRHPVDSNLKIISKARPLVQSLNFFMSLV